jgi:serine kinase of HPr protein (carbohydrate metabolism regulator)
MSGTVHASVARVGGKGVLIRGRSGSGKSSLLLALLSSPDAMLVADDRAHLSVSDDRLIATVPETIAGQMEVRGVGIVRRPFVASTPLDLVVDLLPLAECPRMPLGDGARERLLGIAVPRIYIAIGSHDGAARVIAALARSKADIFT